MWGCGPPTGGRWIRGRADLTPFYPVPGKLHQLHQLDVRVVDTDPCVSFHAMLCYGRASPRGVYLFLKLRS